MKEKYKTKKKERKIAKHFTTIIVLIYAVCSFLKIYFTGLSARTMYSPWGSTAAVNDLEPFLNTALLNFRLLHTITFKIGSMYTINWSQRWVGNIQAGITFTLSNFMIKIDSPSCTVAIERKKVVHLLKLRGSSWSTQLY